MKKIYLIEGETGEYSDRMIWNVAAFLDLPEASAYLGKLRKEAENYQKSEASGCSFLVNNLDGIRETIEKLDPHFQRTYTGTGYNLVEASLLEGSKERPKASKTIDEDVMEWE